MSTGRPQTDKPLFWMGSSRDDLREFPEEVRQLFGFALRQLSVAESTSMRRCSKGLVGQESLKSSTTTKETLIGRFTR